MAATNVLNILRRRSTRPVSELFRNGCLHRSEGVPPAPEVVVLFTWLGAKQKFAHKFADCWTQRGHDVLHVACSVRDLLFPKTGAEVTASRVVDFLGGMNKNVIVHGLSVGGYLSLRVLMETKDSTVNVSHQIFDSFTNAHASSTGGLERGVRYAVHPKYRDLATKLVKVYSKHADLSSITEANHFAVTTPCPAPTLYLHSMADKVAKFDEMQDIVSAQRKVSPVSTYLIPAEEKVPHVSLIKCIGEKRYMGLIDDFVEKHRGTITLKANAPSHADVSECHPKLVLPQ